MVVDTGFITTAMQNGVVRPRTRIAPLRFPAVSATLLTQLAGGVATLAGVYMTLGTGVTLIVGGLAATVLGALREAGKV